MIRSCFSRRNGSGIRKARTSGRVIMTFRGGSPSSFGIALRDAVRQTVGTQGKNGSRLCRVFVALVSRSKLIIAGTAWISWQHAVGQQLSLWYAYLGGDASFGVNQLKSASSCTSYSD